MKIFLLLALFTTVSFTAAHGQTVGPINNQPPKALTETLNASGNFKTLISLMEIAGLPDKGEFTLLAPNDSAFAKLPEGMLEALAKDPEKLRYLLRSHTVPGKLMISDMLVAITDGTSNTYKEVMNLGGDEVSFRCNGAHGGEHHPSINRGTARIGKGDMLFSKGVVHEVDAVLFIAQVVDAEALIDLQSLVAELKQKQQELEQMRQRFEKALRDLEKQNRLRGFEVQELMSDYNQAERLASKVQKKLDETAKGVIQNIK